MAPIAVVTGMAESRRKIKGHCWVAVKTLLKQGMRETEMENQVTEEQCCTPIVCSYRILERMKMPNLPTTVIVTT